MPTYVEVTELCARINASGQSTTEELQAWLEALKEAKDADD